MLPLCLLLNRAAFPTQIVMALEKMATLICPQTLLPDESLDFNALRQVEVAVISPETGIDSAWFEHLPALKLIAAFGVGLDKVDIAKARARHIDITITRDVLTSDTADMSFALLMAVTRQILAGDALIRSEKWGLGKKLPLGTSLSGKKIGIVGLGAIGHDIALKAEVFGMKPRYYNRTPKQVSWPHYDNVVDLARDSDILTVAIAANAQTEKIISSSVLDALGSEGIFINIARGAVVDEEALIDALAQERIAAAGLDVFCHEPTINPAFFDLPNVVLAPHQGSATRETRLKMGQCVLDNVQAFFDGKPLLTAID